MLGHAKVIRSLILVLMLTGSALPLQVSAQDLEPRRWNHLPTGLNMVGIGYAYTEANVFFNPAFKISDARSRINSVGLQLIHVFDLAGKSARISLLLPSQSGRWEGLIDDEFQVIHRRGVGDPRLRMSVNLYGAPALEGSEFVQYRAENTTNTVVGASLAVTLPMGKYCDDCLINVGNNRWSVRPQVGVVHTRGPWSLELTGSVFVFTDNDNFLDNASLKQETTYTAQAHAIYNFRPGLWASISTGYGSGGRISIDHLKTDFEIDNWIWSANFGFAVGKTQSVMLTWLSGRTQNQVGRDSDNLLLGWSTRWGN
jgi:hypothetical protein